MAVASASNAVVADLAAALVMAHAPELRVWAAESLAGRGYHKAAALLCTPPAHADTAGEFPQSTTSPTADVRLRGTPENPIKPQNKQTIAAPEIEVIGSAPALASDVYGPELAAESHRQTVLEAAQELHAAGLNVFPIPLGQKGGGRWKDAGLYFTRLRFEDLPDVFGDPPCNIAVMTGRTSGGLFVLDCESTAAFKWAQTEVRERGIPLWAVVTARGGHIYLRCADGELHSVPPGRVPGLEVRGRGGYVLAPPSIHPDGPIYTWVAREGERPPVVSPDQIDFLHSADGERVTLERERAGGRLSHLGAAARDYLHRGAALPEGERHTAFLKACSDYRRAGLTRAEMEDDLLPHALASGLPAGECAAIMAWVEANVRPATARLARRTTLPDPDRLEWSGRTARTDYAVFAALVTRARLDRERTGIFRASWRELQELAGVMDRGRTLRRSLDRLTARALVERAGTDPASGAALWRFAPGALAAIPARSNGGQNGEITPINQPLDTSGSNFPTSDALNSFSPAERRILTVLTTAAEPLTTRQDIARATGLELARVATALHTDAPLRTMGAIVREGGCWKVGAADPIALQERHDRAAGKRRRVKRRTSDERARRAALHLIEGRRRGGW